MTPVNQKRAERVAIEMPKRLDGKPVVQPPLKLKDFIKSIGEWEITWGKSI